MELIGQIWTLISGLFTSIWSWLTSNGNWLSVIALGLASLSLYLRQHDRRDDRRGRQETQNRKLLTDAHLLLDRLIEAHSPSYEILGLSSDVAKSSEVLAGKQSRKISLMRELVSVALQFPPESFDGVGNKLLGIARSLTWDDGTAVFLKVEVARLINPDMHEEFYDQYALTDEDDET